MRTLLRHPRRLGFILFNVLVLAVVAAWTFSPLKDLQGDIGGLPNLVLGFVGVSFVLFAWIFAWIAWAVMVLRRRQRIARAAAAEAAG